MADDDVLEGELTADEVLTFGPVVESVVWTPMWLQESRAPIAVAAGRPKLGRVFDDRGVGNAVMIRPCMSRGRRVRGLPPIYTPRMLESNASVFDGWPMFCDHAPAELAQVLAKVGRSVKELGGQVLTGRWSKDFVQESDAQFGYQRGGVLGEVWATPFVRRMVGENPNLLHTSINAWPTSGKPGACPWRPAVKGMLIEGIRRQPQGSVDYVVRGGAGGRLLVAEGLEEEGEWPELGEWGEDEKRFVVSLAESFYASRVADLVLPTNPSELKGWLAENAAHLLPALEESNGNGGGGANDDKGGSGRKEDEGVSGLTEADVRRIIQESSSGVPTVEEFEERLTERYTSVLEERDAQRQLSERAVALIESAEGIPVTWKSDLKARYAMRPAGPPQALVIQEAELTDAEGKTLTEEQVLDARVKTDLQHVRDLISEAQGKPRVRGEGGPKADPAGERSSTKRSAEGSFWRSRFAEMGLAESEDKALDLFGDGPEKGQED